MRHIAVIWLGLDIEVGSEGEIFQGLYKVLEKIHEVIVDIIHLVEGICIFLDDWPRSSNNLVNKDDIDILLLITRKEIGQKVQVI